MGQLFDGEIFFFFFYFSTPQVQQVSAARIELICSIPFLCALSALGCRAAIIVALSLTVAGDHAHAATRRQQHAGKCNCCWRR